MEHAEYVALSLDEKMALARELVIDAIRAHPNKTALAWTGGKDSTLMVWIARHACAEAGLPLPPCVFIDEGDTFPEIETFVDCLSREWGLTVRRLRNHDLLRRVSALWDVVDVEGLSRENRLALEEAGHRKPTMVYDPESPVGNHLIKTVPFREYIRSHGVEAMLVALRWDEQETRCDETFSSPRQNPEHLRIHPILPFREADVWAAIHKREMPFCPLYAQGYRSLGTRSGTRPVLPGKPAWEQDLENTPERLGRSREKEAAMARLRSLGYM